jgi:spermidine synthase
MESDERRTVDRARTRNGELQLRAFEASGEVHHELVFDGTFLMASYNAPSSRALTRAIVDRVGGRRSLNFLIGGLGMGYSLREALACPATQSVCVVEVEPHIESWNRAHLGNSDILDDPRTEVIIGDFYDFVQGNPKSYDGIAIDIDNGPDWVIRAENRRVYSLSMLETLRTRLRSGGILTIWGHAAVPSYDRAVREAFETSEMLEVTDHDPTTGKAIEAVIYVAPGPPVTPDLPEAAE